MMDEWKHFQMLSPVVSFILTKCGCVTLIKQYFISEVSKILFFLINMLQMSEAVNMTTSAYFSGTINQEKTVDVIK